MHVTSSCIICFSSSSWSVLWIRFRKSTLPLCSIVATPDHWPSPVTDKTTLSDSSAALSQGWLGQREGGGEGASEQGKRGCFLFSLHALVATALLTRVCLCVCFGRHEDSAGWVGESVEQNLTREHEGSLWRRFNLKKTLFSVGETFHSAFVWSSHVLPRVLMHDSRWPPEGLSEIVDFWSIFLLILSSILADAMVDKNLVKDCRTRLEFNLHVTPPILHGKINKALIVWYDVLWNPLCDLFCVCEIWRTKKIHWWHHLGDLGLQQKSCIRNSGRGCDRERCLTGSHGEMHYG